MIGFQSASVHSTSIIWHNNCSALSYPPGWFFYICSHTPNVDVSDLVYIVPLVLLRAMRLPAIEPSVSSRMVPRTSRAIALASSDGKIVDPNEDTIVEEMEEPPPRCVDNCSVSPVSTITRR